MGIGIAAEVCASWWIRRRRNHVLDRERRGSIVSVDDAIAPLLGSAPR